MQDYIDFQGFGETFTNAELGEPAPANLTRNLEEKRLQNSPERALEHIEAIRRHTAGPVKNVIDWHLDELSRILELKK